MSDKSDDIPQWAWDAAEEPSIEAFDASVDLYETGMETANVQLIVARAILQARSQALEEAIKIVDGYGDAMAMAGEKGEMLPIAPFISQAIRQHSQKGEDNE